MTTPHLIMWVVVVCVGLPAAFRNPTALALTLSWMAGEAAWLITGDNLPVEFYLFPDIFVIAVIAAKHDRQPYLSVWAQLRNVLRERSADRVILLNFPVMWCLYLSPLHPYYVWWSLYALVIVQFLAAGWESLTKPRAARPEASEPKSIIDTHLVVIPFPLQRRGADAVRKTPVFAGALLTANGGGGGG